MLRKSLLLAFVVTGIGCFASEQAVPMDDARGLDLLLQACSEAEYLPEAGGAEPVILLEYAGGSRKTFQCNVCRMCFETRLKVVEHILRHSVFKPFHCPVCPLSFRVPADEYRHIGRRHGRLDMAAFGRHKSLNRVLADFLVGPAMYSVV